MNEVRPEVTYCVASNVLAYTWAYRVQSILLSSMMIASIGTRSNTHFIHIFSGNSPCHPPMPYRAVMLTLLASRYDTRMHLFTFWNR